jgi:N6-adenosine-specific RNA methylase IME4
MRYLSGEQKQTYLIKLATLEGRYNTEVPLQPRTYSCLVADPPWHYELRKADETHRNRTPYRSMTLEQILDLPIPELSGRAGCVLWLWFTNNHAPEAVKCLERWGFELKTILTWEKVTKAGNPHIGTGHWLRNCTEHCALATRGKVASFSHTKLLTNQSTILRAPRTEHSRKPEAFYQLVEHLCPGSKLEMFSRRSRDGWDGWGDEAVSEALAP